MTAGTLIVEDRSRRKAIVIAGVLGALGVLIGAFGAHGLEGFLAAQGYPADLLAKRLGQFDVGVRYHLVHALAVLGLAGLPMTSARVRTACLSLFVAGVVFFSGSLYLLVITNKTWLGAITPIGGVVWILAWLCLAIAAGRSGGTT